MPAPYTTKSNPTTERAARAMFLDTMNKTPQHPLMALAEFVRSTNLKEFYGGLGEVAEMAIYDSAPKVVTPLPERQKEAQNRRYQASHEIHKDAIRFDSTGRVEAHIRRLAMQAKLFPGVLISNILRQGITTTVGVDLDYSGGAIFRTNHPAEGDAPVQSNRISPTGVTASALQTDFRTARAALRKLKGSNGAPINEGLPLELIVVVPPDLEGAMTEALKSQLISNTTNPEALKNYTILVDDRMTVADDWFIANVAGDKPIVVQEADPVTLSVLGEGSEYTTKTGKMFYGVEWMGKALSTFWQRMVMVG